jgi:hypothetical protein
MYGSKSLRRYLGYLESFYGSYKYSIYVCIILSTVVNSLETFHQFILECRYPKLLFPCIEMLKHIYASNFFTAKRHSCLLKIGQPRHEHGGPLESQDPS